MEIKQFKILFKWFWEEWSSDCFKEIVKSFKNISKFPYYFGKVLSWR